MKAKILKTFRKKAKRLKRASVLAMREFFALLHVAGLRHTRYAHLVFSKTLVMRFLRTTKGYAKEASLFTVKATAMALVAVMIFVPLLQAFEAHVINVTAVPIQIDPPVHALPGPGTSWNDPAGAFGLTSPINVTVTENDPDATHLYYTFKNGTTSPDAVIDPVCGGPLGGPVSGSYLVYVPSNTVIKSIACDGTTALAHHSVVNTKIYTFACEPKNVDFSLAGPAVEAGGSSSSFDDVLIDANTEVKGTVRSNHDIKAHAASSRNITGDAIAVGIVDPEFNVFGTTSTGSPSSNLPELELNYWKDEAKAGGTVLGSILIPSSATTGSLSLGPSEINGDLIIGSNNDIIITGTLYVHGNIVIDSNVNVTQTSEYQDKLSMIVADGTIQVDSNVTFQKFGGPSATGAFILVSTHAALPGNPAAVELNSNAGPHDVGDVILFAASGDVRVHSNNTVLGVFGMHGTDASYPAVMLDSNVIVSYRAVSGQVGCGKTFYASSNIVINEFMPNPIGLDEALMPGGEWVELYNGTGTDKDLAGWALYDIGNDPLLITATNTDLSTTTIPSGGHLVVFRNGNAGFNINNKTDKLSLYNKKKTEVGALLIDSYEYDLKNAVDANKSFARMPDGSANWIDPDATPGEENETFIVDTVPADLAAIVFTYPEETLELAPAELVSDVASSTEATSTELSTAQQASSTDGSLASETQTESSGGGSHSSEPMPTATETPATTQEPEPQATEPVITTENPSEPTVPAEEPAITEPVPEEAPASEPVVATEPAPVVEEPKQEVLPVQETVTAPVSTEPTEAPSAPVVVEAPAGE